ncbi:hypothetical protein ABPG74_000504 [Tetrahymena malaccensis]
MEIRSIARTQNSHKNEKKYFELLQEYSSNQLNLLNQIKNEFVKEELKNICHYILSKTDLLLLNIEVMYIIISRLQQISSEFSSEINIDHFASINQVPLSSELSFVANFNSNCQFLKLKTKSKKGEKVKRDKKNQEFQSSTQSIKYEILSDQDFQKQFDFFEANIQNHYNFIYDVRYNSNYLQLQLQQQRSGQSTEKQKLIEADIQKLKNKNYQIHFSRIISENTDEIDSFILQANVTQKNQNQIIKNQVNQISPQVLNQKNSKDLYQNKQINQIPQLVNKTNMPNQKSVQNQNKALNQINNHKMEQKENQDLSQGCKYVLPIAKVFYYQNAFGEDYYVQLREQEEYSLMDVVIELEKKQLRYSEQEMIAILSNIFEGIQYFHDRGYVVGSFSPYEVVFHQERWKLKHINQMQQKGQQNQGKNLNSLYQVKGYFEFMSPQQQQLLKMNTPVGNYNAQASDLYNLGTLINALSSPKQQYSPFFNQIIKQLTDYDSLARMDSNNIRNLLQPYKFCIRKGLDITKQKDQLINYKKLYQSFMSLGSKSLAISSVHAAHPKEDYHSFIEKGFLYQVFQEHADAITYYRKAEQNALSQNKLYNLIPINNNIGQILLKNGKYEQALQSFQKAADVSRQVCSSNSLEYAKSLENLSNAYTNLEKYKEAEKCFEEVLNIKKKLIRNENDMQFSITYNNLGIVQEKQDKKQQAISNFRKAVDVMQYHLGTTNPDIANFNEKIGDLFFSLPGRQEDALNHYQQSYKIFSALKDSNQIHKIQEKIKRIQTKSQR